ncbi:MAG: hypothetical protein MUC36_09180 [Planctomycetes bacterium]|nr:hypothetical protein [Planctomycetota bacterium]
MRILSPLLLLPTLATALYGQCFTPAGGTAIALTSASPPIAANDEGRSAPIPLGFAFPMPGITAPTHAVIESNGAIYLTNGGPAVGTVLFGPQNGVDDLRGGPGGSPRIVVLWSDLEGIAATWAIRTDTTVPGQFTVRWIDVENVGSGGPTVSFGATLFSNGDIELAYGNLAEDSFGYAGVSVGNDVGTGLEVGDDLVAGASSGPLGLLFGDYLGLSRPQISGKSVRLQQNGLGGYSSSLTCRNAEHENYGFGCYEYQEANEALYQLFPNVAASFAAIPSGTSIQFTIAGNGGYQVANGTAVFVPPPATATVLTLTDDSQVNVTPSQPFPYTDGTLVPTIAVCSNGFISMAPTGVNSNGTGGSVTSLLNAPAPSFRSQRDYNPAPAASGKVKRHEAVVGGQPILYVTWDNVFIYNTTVSERFQFQLNLATGEVAIVWDTLVPTVTSTSRPLLVGLAAGNSFNPGPTVLATQLPQLTFPDVDQRPLQLDADPAPVINPSTAVTYTLTNLPEAAPGTGIHLAALFLSVGSVPGGLDLGFLGAPGCSAWIASLDLPVVVPPSLTNTATSTVVFSAAQIPAGSVIYAQAVALFNPAFPLPNGQNAFGLLTSNGVRSFVEPF